MYQPKTGDRVRVVLEGTVHDMAQGDFEIGPGDEGNYITPSADHVVSIELLAPAEPPIGTVILADASGIAYQREPLGWLATGSTHPVSWTQVKSWDSTILFTPDSE